MHPWWLIIDLGVHNHWLENQSFSYILGLIIRNVTENSIFSISLNLWTRSRMIFYLLTIVQYSFWRLFLFAKTRAPTIFFDNSYVFPRKCYLFTMTYLMKAFVFTKCQAWIKQSPEYLSSYYTLLPDCVHTLLHYFRVSYSPPRGFWGYRRLDSDIIWLKK